MNVNRAVALYDRPRLGLSLRSLRRPKQTTVSAILKKQSTKEWRSSLL
jgi:hypothetical protein